jgi:cardiolipin synthase A/B
MQPSPPHISTPCSHRVAWFGTGYDLLEAKLAAIASAKTSIRMETYIYTDEEIGRRFRTALVDAGKRGVKVKLLVDAIGGSDLPHDYFKELDELHGSHMKWFNRPSLATWSFRDHRKLLIIDRETVFVGGCNIASEYHGNGITHGWRDGGARVDGEVAEEIATEFERMWSVANARQWADQATKAVKGKKPKPKPTGNVKALFVSPGFGQSPLRDAVREDLKTAKRVDITSAYFLPSQGLRRQLGSAVGRGARVRLLLGGKSDVKLMQYATRSLYSRLLDARIEVWEYNPQILHSKVLILDDVVYIGSSNLDPRSLRINFEVMLRIQDNELAEQARAAFEADLKLSTRVTHETNWNLGWWTKFKQSCAHWILARVDPRMSEGMLRRLENRA